MDEYARDRRVAGLEPQQSVETEQRARIGVDHAAVTYDDHAL